MRNRRMPVVAALAVGMASALAGTAQAAPGDGVDSTNGFQDASFHTKDCRGDAYFRYLHAAAGNGGLFYVATSKTGGPAWCRFGVSITYRRGGKTGPMVTTPVIWNDSRADFMDTGLRCTTTHYIQRPGDGWYTVTLRNEGAGC